MGKDTIELKLIEEEELLSGLLILTENNLGKASILLGKVKKETVKAIRAQITQDNTPQLDAAIKETVSLLQNYFMTINHQWFTPDTSP